MPVCHVPFYIAFVVHYAQHAKLSSNTSSTPMALDCKDQTNIFYLASQYPNFAELS